MDNTGSAAHDWTKRYRLAAGVYAMRGDQLLMLERARGMMIGFWSVPGGIVDPYTCQCEAGDVRLSHEHSSWGWADPARYRATHVGDAAVEHWRQSSQDDAFNVLSNRNGLDDFLHWRNHH